MRIQHVRPPSNRPGPPGVTKRPKSPHRATSFPGLSQCVQSLLSPRPALGAPPSRSPVTRHAAPLVRSERAAGSGRRTAPAEACLSRDRRLRRLSNQHRVHCDASGRTDGRRQTPRSAVVPQPAAVGTPRHGVSQRSGAPQCRHGGELSPAAGGVSARVPAACLAQPSRAPATLGHTTRAASPD